MIMKQERGPWTVTEGEMRSSGSESQREGKKVLVTLEKEDCVGRKERCGE